MDIDIRIFDKIASGISDEGISSVDYALEPIRSGKITLIKM